MELGSSVLGSNFIFTHAHAKKERLVEVREQCHAKYQVNPLQAHD